MSADNFQSSLRRVLVHEGGYSNDAADPGGQTMWGITWRDYNAYRILKRLPRQDVRRMTTAERDEIYHKKYWVGGRCDDLPSGVDYVVFDGGVNSGVAQSVKWLQRALGSVTVDGHIGDHTLLAAHRLDPATLIKNMCDQRMRFLKALRTFNSFGKGWSRRVADVRSVALNMVEPVVEEQHLDAPDASISGAKATVADVSVPPVSQNVATAATAATGGMSGVVQQMQEQLAPYSETLNAIKYALLAAAVVGLCLTIYAVWKNGQLKGIK